MMMVVALVINTNEQSINQARIESVDQPRASPRRYDQHTNKQDRLDKPMLASGD